MLPLHSSPWPSRPFFSTFICLSLVLHSSFQLAFTNGQAAPSPVTGPAHARYGPRFYIVGGHLSVNGTLKEGYSQFFYLDLSVSWEASAPIWKQLNAGPVSFDTFAAMSLDGQTLAVVRPDALTFIMRYSVQGNSWSPSKATVPDLRVQGASVGTDATTGMIYAVDGYDGLLDRTLAFDFVSDAVNLLKTNTNMWRGITYSRSVPWPQAKSILFFGGYDSSGSQDTSQIMQFTPATGVWASLVYRNPALRPPPLADHCMAIADDGSKLVIFGGRPTLGAMQGVLSGDLYVLDLTTMAWTRGQSYKAPRIYPACTIYGSTFISWGGQDTARSVGDGPILYDLNTNKYITRFTSPVNGTRSPSTSGTLPNPSGVPGGDKDRNTGAPDGSTANVQSNLGAIIGGAVGALAVILAALLVYFYIRRRTAMVIHNSRSEDSQDKPSPAIKDDGENGAGPYPADGHSTRPSSIPIAWPWPWPSKPNNSLAQTRSRQRGPNSPQLYEPTPVMPQVSYEQEGSSKTLYEAPVLSGPQYVPPGSCVKRMSTPVPHAPHTAPLELPKMKE